MYIESKVTYLKNTLLLWVHQTLSADIDCVLIKLSPLHPHKSKRLRCCHSAESHAIHIPLHQTKGGPQ